MKKFQLNIEQKQFLSVTENHLGILTNFRLSKIKNQLIIYIMCIYLR